MQHIHLDGKSFDIVSENVSKLKSLFPEIVKEDTIDFDELRNILGSYVDKDESAYRFTWHGKQEAFKKSQVPSMGTLRPCVEESKDWENTQNLYIEGDNLEVLKLLQSAYFNKVKMIYIDPPYNKDKDFVYSDTWSDPIAEYKRITGQVDDDDDLLNSDFETEGGRHTNWLNMIYPRLRLARNLLTDDGVIFISIDDDEQANLKKVCDEVFGEENLIEQIIWKKRGSPPNDKVIAAIHEYILIYAKNKLQLQLFRKERSVTQLDRYKNPDNHPKGRWAPDNLMANIKGGRYTSSLYFPIINKITGEEHYPSSNGNWRFNKEKIDNLLANDEIYFGDNNNGRPKLKRFLCDVQEGVPFSTLFDDVGYTNSATAEMNQFIGSVNFFDTPKPLELMKRILQLSTSDSDIILDFFSGSATTAHAVMQLNAEDGGNRRFIMVQLPEQTDEKSEAFKAGYKNICEIGKERIRRAGNKIQEEKREQEQKSKKESLPLFSESSDLKENSNSTALDTGFKVFKLDSSNLKRWNLDVGEDFDLKSDDEKNTIIKDKLGLLIHNYEDDRTDFDMIFEVMLKYGLDLTLPVEEFILADKKVFSLGLGALIMCFSNDLDVNLAVELVKKIEELQPLTVRVVIKDLGFTSSPDKSNFKETLRNGVENYFTTQKDLEKPDFEFITI